jgi:thiol-disulfide isomerase/thioredoxin
MDSTPWLLDYMNKHAAAKYRGDRVHIDIFTDSDTSSSDSDDSDTSSSDSEYSDSVETHSSDSDDEPSSASSEENVPRDKPITMGADVVITNEHNTFFSRDGVTREVTQADFSHIADKAFVMFFMSTCPHCIHMMPVYQSVMKYINEHDNYSSYAVSNKEHSLCSHYGIDGFPTILYLEHKQKMSMYEQGPNEKELMKWAKKCIKGVFSEKPDKHFLLQRLQNHLQGIKPKERKETFFEKGTVIEITPDDIPILSKENTIVLMFFAPWCGYCQEAKPEYEILSKKVSFPLYAINCEEYKNVSSRYGVDGFPSFRKIQDGKVVSTYDRERIAAYMEKWAVDKVEEVDVPDSDSINPDVLSIVMFYAPWCGHCVKSKPNVNKFITEFKKESSIPCMKINCDEHKEIQNTYGINGFPTIAATKDKKIVKKYDGDRSVDSLLKWAREQ